MNHENRTKTFVSDFDGLGRSASWSEIDIPLPILLMKRLYSMSVMVKISKRCECILSLTKSIRIIRVWLPCYLPNPCIWQPKITCWHKHNLCGINNSPAFLPVLFTNKFKRHASPSPRRVKFDPHPFNCITLLARFTDKPDGVFFNITIHHHVLGPIDFDRIHTP